MLIRFSFLVLLLNSHVIEAQTNNSVIDSLEKVLNKFPTNDSTRANLFIAKGNALMYSNPKEGLHLTDSALTLSKRINWKLGIAKSHRQEGAIYAILSDLPKALQSAHLALKAAEGLGDKQFDAGVYNNIGQVYLELNENDKAINNFQKLLTVSKDMNSRRTECIALLNIGLAYMRKESLDNAKAFLNNCISLAEKEDFSQAAAYAYSNLGAVYNREKKFDSAIILFNKSIKHADKTSDINIKAQSLNGISEAYIFNNLYNTAEKYAVDGLRLSKQIGSIQYEKESTEMLSDIYQKQGKFEKALETFKRFILLRDSIINDEKKSELVKKEMLFENERKETILKAKHAAALQQQKTTRNYLIGGAGIVILASGLLFFSYKRRRDAVEKRKDAELKAQIADTEMKVMRLQMNPHFIFNSLNSISDYIVKNKPQEADSYLSKFAKVMRMTLEHSEQKAISLADDLQTLALYMELEAKRLNDKFTYEINVAGDIDQENTFVPPMIFQPFVENSIWHGIAKKEGKGQITVNIYKKNEMLYCAIDDNGIGIEKAKDADRDVKKESMGTKITKARIDLLNRLKGSNATVQLIDKPGGNGVKAELYLPLDEQV